MEPNSRLKLEAISVTLAILLVSVPIHNDVEYALQSEAKSADTIGGNSFIDAPTSVSYTHLTLPTKRIV